MVSCTYLAHHELESVIIVMNIITKFLLLLMMLLLSLSFPLSLSLWSLNGMPGCMRQTSSSTPAQPDAAKLAPPQLLDLGKVVGLNLLQRGGDLHGGLLDFLPLARACPLTSSHTTAHHQPAPAHASFCEADVPTEAQSDS